MGFLADWPMVVSGSVTGAAYLFGPRGTWLEVDRRDVPALLESGQFARRPVDRTATG